MLLTGASPPMYGTVNTRAYESNPKNRASSLTARPDFLNSMLFFILKPLSSAHQIAAKEFNPVDTVLELKQIHH